MNRLVEDIAKRVRNIQGGVFSGVDPEDYYNVCKKEGNLFSGFFKVIAGGNVSVVDYFLKKGMDVNSVYAGKYGDSALGTAVENDQVEMALFLLSKGADPELGYEAPIVIACRKGHIKIVKALLDKGADVNIKSRRGTCLYWAIGNRRAQLTRLLLKSGADADGGELVFDEGSHTIDLPPLKQASRFGWVWGIKELIKHGAKIDLKNPNGVTALYFAAQEGREESVDVLLKNKANPNVIHSTTGHTPLWHAVRNGSSGIIKNLLAHGADPNLYGKEPYSTPPIDAAITYCLACLTEDYLPLIILLEAGADPNIVYGDKGYGKMNPLGNVYRMKDERFKVTGKILRKYGAKPL